MPQALKVDWNYIQSLYLKGLTPKKISEQTGIKADSVSNRAHRYKWREALAKASVVVKAHNDLIEANPQAESALAKQSARARDGLAGVLTRFVEKIETLEPKSPKHALAVSQELESVVRNCKTVFGWSEGQSQPAVRIAIMGNATIASDPTPESKPVIDVESGPSADSRA